MIFLCCLLELLLVVSRGLSAVFTVDAAAAFCSTPMDAVCCFITGICWTLEETELQWEASLDWISAWLFFMRLALV